MCIMKKKKKWTRTPIVSKILSRVGVTYKTGFGSMIGFIAPYAFTQFRSTGNYSAIAILHTLQLTVAHALEFSVLTSRILVTDLSQSHCNFKSHMKSSWQFLQFLFNHFQLPSPELDPIPFLAAWDPRYTTSRRTDRRHRFLYCYEGMFTAPLRNNDNYSVFGWVFAARRMCLPSRCLTMGIHVTIFFRHMCTSL
jgi:hypothetical protein